MSTCCPTQTSYGWDWIPTTPPASPDCNSSGTVSDQPWVADWEIDTAGALAEDNQLHSAVIIQLFTEKRVPSDQNEYITEQFNRGGWWGDYYAPFEIGSHLWTLRRAPLTDATLADAERFTREALQPLVDQGAAARLDVSINANKTPGHMTIVINLYGRDGDKVYSGQFARLW